MKRNGGPETLRVSKVQTADLIVSVRRIEEQGPRSASAADDYN